MERIKLDIQKFATSGRLLTPANEDGTTFFLDWNRSSYSVENNTSTIYWVLGINAKYSYYTNAVSCGPVIINGETVYGGGTYSNISSGTHGITGGHLTISHNDDGTKSFSASISGWTWGCSWVSKNNNDDPFILNTIPRYTNTTKWSVTSKTETSITLNWQTAEICSQIRYGTSTSSYTTANVNSNSGSVTISGLTANQNYTLYFMPKRKDSNLWGNGSANTWKSTTQSTYNYPNCTSAPNFTIGNSVTLQFYNPLNRTFAIRLWSHSSSAFVSDSININGTSYTFTPNANTLYASIPNSKSSVYNVDSTYNSNKIVKVGGSYSVNESTDAPTFNDFDYADTNATTLALTGDSTILVRNYSDVRATVSTSNKAIAKNSATMVKYNLMIGDATPVSVNYSDSASVTTPTINSITSNIINLNAEDSRGLTTLVSKTATIKNYTDIQKGNINITRTGNVGEAVTLNFDGTYWNESFGSVTNTITSANISYKYKKTSDNTWSTGSTTITPTLSNNTYSYSGGIVGDVAGVGFNTQYSYNIEVTVADKLSSTTFTFVLGSGQPWLGIHNNGIAIKQPYDTSDDSVLQVNGKTHLKGNTSVTGTLSSTGNGSIGGSLTIGSYTRNTSDTWVPVINSGKLDYTLRKIVSSKTHTDYNNNQDYLATMSMLTYWNGAYNSSNSSNLTYAHQGTIQCKPTELYNNSSGTTGTVNLSQTVANFDYIEIFFKQAQYTSIYNSVKLYKPSNVQVSMTAIQAENGGSGIASAYSVVNGTTITKAGYNIYWTNAGNDHTDKIYVTRVVGWK